MRKTTSGFTIVELLIVIVAIAILAAISTVAYSGIQNRANDTAVQSDLRQLASQIKQHEVLHGAPPFPSTFQTMGVKLTKNAYKTVSNSNVLYCRIGTSWGLLAQSKSESAYKYMHDSGLSKYTPTWTQNSNANLCTSIGFSSTDPGYEYAWMHLWTIGWESWVQG